MTFNYKLPAQPLKAIVPEFGTVVMDDPSRYSESENQNFIYEVHQVRCFHFTEWNSLIPLAEVIRRGKYESMASAGGWSNGPNDVYSPHIERP